MPAQLDPSSSTAAGGGAGMPPPPLAPRRTLWLLVDGDGGLRRLSVQAGSVEELVAAVRAAVGLDEQKQQQQQQQRLDLEVYDPLQERFGPLPTDLAALPSLVRLRVSSSNTTATADGSSSCSSSAAAEAATLALPWRRFPVDLEREGFEVGGRRLVVCGVANSGEGTGHTTWDGAILLAKYLEHAYCGKGEGEGERQLRGKRVLETGAGTGLVGLACAALGAEEVVLTDLPYTLRNLEANARRNEAALAGSGCRVRVQEGDWFKPPGNKDDDGDGDSLGPVDLVVAADVVWLDELVLPLAEYLRAVLDRPGSRHAEALMSYQTRSTRTEALLLESLRGQGLHVERVDPGEHHPDFRAPNIHVFRIRLRS